MTIERVYFQWFSPPDHLFWIPVSFALTTRSIMESLASVFAHGRGILDYMHTSRLLTYVHDTRKDKWT